MDNGETLIFLDLNSKLASDIFEKEAFIRLVNLHKKNPLLQINDTLFKGHFDHSVGTNLFFEANDELPEYNDVFIKRGSTQFNNVACETKIISMKPVKVPPQKVQFCKETKKVEFNLDWDYNTILEKFSDGSLKLEDILKDGIQQDEDHQVEPTDTEINMEIEDEETTNKDNITEHMDIPTVTEEVDESVLDKLGSAKILEEYNRLTKLAFRPVKTHPIQEDIQECDPKFKDAYELHNLQQQVLQPCDFFHTEPVTEIDENTLTNCVDIDRCILYRLLDKSALSPRILTQNEKRKVFSIENFDNLSLAGRYYVLENHINNMEQPIKIENENEFSTEQECDETARSLQIFKKLAGTLKKRLEEIKYSLKDINEEDELVQREQRENT